MMKPDGSGCIGKASLLSLKAPWGCGPIPWVWSAHSAAAKRAAARLTYTTVCDTIGTPIIQWFHQEINWQPCSRPNLQCDAAVEDGSQQKKKLGSLTPIQEERQRHRP